MSEYLDRKQVIDLYEKFQPSLAIHVYEFGEALRKLPVTQDSHGEWEKYGDKIEAFDIAGHKTWGQKRRCTNCGFIHTYIEDFGFYPFCPNCSALMYKEEGEAE